MLLAILKKRKKVSFTGYPFSKNRTPRLQSPKLTADPRDDTKEIPVVQKTPRAKEVQSNLSQESFPLLADAAESALDAALPNTQPNNPPSNPLKSLPYLIAKFVDGVDCPNGGPNGEANDE